MTRQRLKDILRWSSMLLLLVGLLGEVMDYRLCVTVCGFVTLIACWLFIFGGRKEVRKVYEGA